MTEPVLVLDFGGVLSVDWGPPVPRVMEFALVFPGKVVIVSHCGIWVRDRTEAWLQLHHVRWERFFVRHPADKEPVVRALRAHTVVDDRRAVLVTMTTVPNRIWVHDEAGETVWTHL